MARDAVKVLNKQATNNKKPASLPVVVPPTVASASPAPLAEKKRERGNISVAARILQRDLGLGGGHGRGGRGGRRGGSVAAAKADATPSNSQAQIEAPKTIVAAPEKSQTTTQRVAPPDTAPQSANSKEDTTSPQSQIPSSTAGPPTGPAAARNNAKSNPQLRASKMLPAKTPTPSRAPIVSPTATQAFLKHANPSQGITEPLLEETFSGFGNVTKVEIDKKKGFAYVDFAEPDGLQKAIEASPVKVAQGQVVVLERKTGPTLQARNARGGPAMIGNRGGGVPMGPRGGRGSMRRGGGPGRPQVKSNDPSTVKTSQASNTHESPSAAPVQHVKAGGASEPDTAPPSAATGT